MSKERLGTTCIVLLPRFVQDTDLIRLAISLGGDSDTIGAMAGAIAACMYPIPDDIAERCQSILTEDLREIKDRFCEFIDRREK